MKTVFLFMLSLSCLLCVEPTYAQLAIHTDGTIPNVTFQSGKKVGYLSLYQNLTKDIQKAKNKTLESYVVVDMVQEKIYKSLNDVGEGISQAKSGYYALQKVGKMTENLVKAGRLAAGKPYLLAYYRKVFPVMVGRATELSTYVREYIQKNKRDVLMTKAARDQFLYKTYEDINILYNMSEAMLAQFKRVRLAEAVNSVVPYQYYIDMDRSIVNSTLDRIKGLL